MTRTRTAEPDQPNRTYPLDSCAVSTAVPGSAFRDGPDLAGVDRFADPLQQIMTLDSSGESGDPCGVPSSLAHTTPSAMIPASKNLRINRSTRRSPTLRDTRAINASC